MNGYFSKLVQQTGITFKSPGGSGSVSKDQASFKKKTKDLITPRHFDEYGLSLPEQDQAFETTNDSIVGDSESSYHISEHEALHQPIEERYVTKIVQDRQSQMSGSQKSGHRVEKPERIKQNHTEMDLQLPSKEQRQKSLVTSDLIREGERMINVNNETKEDHVESGEGLFTPVHQLKNESVFKPVITSNEKISQAQTWQSYLREVREWVAATPEDKQVGLNNSEQARVSDIKKSALTSIDEDRGLIKDYYGQKESQKDNELEVNDFHLSIGTINLTIEEPRNEVQSKKPPPIKISEEKRHLESESARLSRHYIRIR